MTPRRVFALVTAAWILAGCIGKAGNADEIRQSVAPTADMVAATAPDRTGAIDGGARAIRCPSSGSAECVYVADGRPIESRVVGNRRKQPTPTSGAEQVAIAPNVDEAPPAAFEGMWEYDPDDGGHMAELCGYLIIEDPYVYVLATQPDSGDHVDPALSRTGDGDLEYWMIQLPRAATRYNPHTRSLWVFEEGPMTDGDHVSVSGGTGSVADLRSGNGHGRPPWQANGMEPAGYPC